MLGNLKINTALFICSAFIFKFLFLNIGAVSSITTHQATQLAKTRFSATTKRNRGAEVADHSATCNYSTLEICEETPKDDDHFKLNIFLPLLVLYVLVAGKLSGSLQKIIPSPQHFAYTSSHRYLALRTFRI